MLHHNRTWQILSYAKYMSATTRYTKELLEAIVPDCLSVTDVLRALGLRPSGGNNANIRRRLKQYNIDTSHFLGQSYNLGRSFARKSAAEVLVLRPTDAPKVNRKTLLRAMLELGFDYRCELCGNAGAWKGSDLCLEIDHVDGWWNDNRPDNLRFLCPNCHSQQPTSHTKKRAA